MKKVNILETTLRDGSYAINFSFTESDTAIICKKLEEVGFEYIEIGHGVGLNASNAGYGTSTATDEEYMIAAKEVLKNAKYGMFCIPGIARVEDLDIAAKHEMGFVRIGTNVTEVSTSEPFIKKAKDYGMFVAANFMKSYALPPEEFAKQVKVSEEYGTDMVYLVDSAGGMFGEDMRKYYKAIRELTDIPVGFHGHDNLGMAVSNSLAAADMGMEFVDSSLQGLGRSAGNASTEILVTALLKRGYETGIDLLELLKIGEKYIRPLVSTRGKMPLDIISGYAEFHSSYMGYIQKYSTKYNVDPMLLIMKMCEVDKVKVEEDTLDKVAQQLKHEEEIYTGKYPFNKYFGHEQDAK